MAPQEIKLTRIAPEQAAAMIEAARVVDFASGATPAAIVDGGECLELRDGDNRAALVLKKHGNQLWVSAFAAPQASRGLTDIARHAVEELARQAGCRRVAFQTERPGLVRAARRAGYRVSGFILEKDL